MPIKPNAGREDQQTIDQKRQDENREAAKAIQSSIDGLADSFDDTISDLEDRSKKLSSVNQKIIKDNSEFFNKKASEFFANAEKFEKAIDQSGDDVPDELMAEIQQLADISNQASVADFKTLKELKTMSTGLLKMLDTLPKGNSDIDSLIEATKDQVDLLKGSTGIMDGIGMDIKSMVAGTMNALTGRDSTAVFENIVGPQLLDIKERQGDIGEQMKAASDDFTDKVSEEIGTIVQLVTPEDSTLKESTDRLYDILGTLDDMEGDTSRTSDLLESWMGGSEEERREALNRHNEMIDVMAGKKDPKEGKEKTGFAAMFKKFGGLFIGAIATMFGGIISFVGGLAPLAVKFMLKSLPKLLLRFVALPIAIVGGLISGISDAVDVWRKTGSIKEAIIAGLAGVLDFITFGFIDADLGKKIFGTIFDTFTKLVDDVKGIFNLSGDTIPEIFSSGFDKIVEHVFVMWDNLVADMKNIASFFGPMISEAWDKIKAAFLPAMASIGKVIIGGFEWLGNKLIDGIMFFADPIINIISDMFSWVGSLFTDIMDDVAVIWNTAKSNVMSMFNWYAGIFDDILTVAETSWNKVKDSMLSMFDWLAEIFSVETLKKLLPDFIADRLVAEEPDQQNGIDRAEDVGAIDRNIVGKSEILDPAALNELNAVQVKELINLNDWSDNDMTTLQDLFTKKVNDALPENVTSIEPAIIQRDKTFVTETQQPVVEQPQTEMVKGDTSAQKIDAAIVSLDKARHDKTEREQVEKRRIDAAASKTSVHVNNNTKNNTTVIDTDKPYDTDNMLAQSENRNYVG